MTHRVFLDANVLFSAAHTPQSGLRELWELPDTALVTSEYAINEAMRNPDPGPARERLDALLATVERVESPQAFLLPVQIHDKDAPILAAAAYNGCTHLLTGDKRHFGSLLGHRVEGVLVLRPAQYLAAHRTANDPDPPP